MGDECLVFDEASAVTHLLTMPGAQVLRSLAQGPCTFEALVEGLAREFAEASREEVVASVTDSLSHFRKLGLLSPAEADSCKSVR